AKKITSKEAVYLLFDEIAPAIDSERQGGYTRLIRVGNRKGDNAPLMRVEIVLEKLEKKAVVKAAETTAAKAAEKVEEAPVEEAAEAPVEEAAVEETAEAEKAE
ncbi:L17 family ribosomal protein, partial [Schaalia hyovaginalis]